MAGEGSSSSGYIPSNIGEIMTEQVKDITLMNTFRILLPQFGLDEKIIITDKLYPIARDGRFYSKDFGKTITSVRMQYLHMYLVHYPTGPGCLATDSKNVKLNAQVWVAVSQLNDRSKVNAIGVYNYSVTHLIQLTEVVAVGPSVYQMRWYSYYSCPHGGVLLSNTFLKEQPSVKRLARQYNVSTAQILLLWTLQKGRSLVPKVTNSSLAMEQIQLNFRLTPSDLSFLDLCLVYINNTSVF